MRGWISTGMVGGFFAGIRTNYWRNYFFWGSSLKVFEFVLAHVVRSILDSLGLELNALVDVLANQRRRCRWQTSLLGNDARRQPILVDLVTLSQIHPFAFLYCETSLL